MRKAARGRLVLRVRAGAHRDDIAHHRDVAAGRAQAVASVDGGAIDRVVRRYSPGLQATRVFRSRLHVAAPGRGHVGWDGRELALGLDRVLRVELDPDAPLERLCAALSELEAVERVSPAYLCETPFSVGRAARAPSLWPFEAVGASEARALEPGDPTVIVGVIDSGVALHHAEFRGKLRRGLRVEALDAAAMPHGLELLQGDADGLPEDGMGHGSACAGIIGAVGREVPPGLAGSSPILPIRALASARDLERGHLTAIGSLPDIDDGWKVAIDLGARVLNLSFGTPASSLRPDDPAPHAEMVAYSIEHGCVLVAASGNSGDEESYFPAVLDGVLAVGAVGPDGVPSPFTTRGTHVALSAPGQDVPCVAVEGYARESGTSFAAPFVSAAAALLVARGERQATPVEPELVRALLTASARPFAEGADARGCGAGILDVPAALRAMDARLRESAADARRPHKPEPRPSI